MGKKIEVEVVETVEAVEAPVVEVVEEVEVVGVSSHDNVTQHFDVDPNDPRVKH